MQEEDRQRRAITKRDTRSEIPIERRRLRSAAGVGNDQPVLFARRCERQAPAISTNAPLEFLNNPRAAHGFDNEAADPGGRPVVAAEQAFMKHFSR